MKKIRTILIDDEVASLNALRWELEPYQEEVEIIAQCDSPKIGIDAIKDLQPDLVFLDIEMPGMNGFELLHEIGAAPTFRVIFTTAYDEFAIKAIRADAIDYLLKPISADELRNALDKVKNQVKSSGIDSHLEKIISKIEHQSTAKRISLPTHDGVEFVEVQKISHCQSDGNYTRIFTEKSSPILISKTLKEVEEMLPKNQFFRVHHSFLVNLDFVKKYMRNNGSQIVLQNGVEIPVARRRKDELLQKLTN